MVPLPSTSSPSSHPAHWKPIESRAYSRSRLASASPGGEIEVNPIPEVGLDDPPAADQSAVRRVVHAA